MEFRLDIETYNSLKRNPDLSGVSEERIRDEFIKLLKRAKDLKKALARLKELSILHQLFPTLKIEIDKIGDSPLVTVALMLRNNIDEPPYELRRLQTQLNQSRWFLDEIGIISYLVRLQNLSPTTAFQLKKSEKRCKVSTKEIIDFLLRMDKNPQLIRAYCRYQITTDPIGLMSMGFKNADLGKELERIETELFLEILKEELDDL